MARLYAELAQTRRERDEAYALFAHLDGEIQAELRQPDVPGRARQELVRLHTGFTAVMSSETFQCAQQRGFGD